MPQLWWLRPVSSACRVGAQIAVVWKRMYLRPRAASFSHWALAGTAKGARRAEAGCRRQDDQHVGGPLGGRSGSISGCRVRVLRVVGDRAGSLLAGSEGGNGQALFGAIVGSWLNGSPTTCA